MPQRRIALTLLREQSNCAPLAVGRVNRAAAPIFDAATALTRTLPRAPYTWLMQGDWLRHSRNAWAWYSSLDVALSIPSRLILFAGLIATVVGFVYLNPEWAVSLFLALALLVAVVMLLVERRRRRSAEHESRTATVAAECAPHAIEIEPRVERDWDYGPRRDTSAYLIVARVKSVDGRVHSDATGTLVSVEPLDDGMQALYAARGAFPSGSLRWSARYGSDERARITPAGVDLDVFVFEGTDERGIAAYRDGSLRSRRDLMLLDGCDWRVTVEVAVADAHAQCVFVVSAGKQDPDDPLVIWASPEGTLFPPEVTRQPRDARGS